jgi:ABC-type multidrug transport system fused ATPase/permease subunit
LGNALRELTRARSHADDMKSGQSSDLQHTVQLLSHFLVGQRRLVVLALVMLIIEAITAVLEAYPLAYLIDFLKGDRSSLTDLLGFPLVVSPTVDTIALLTAAIVVMAMVNSLADSLAEIFLARGGRILGFNIRVALYAHLQRLSLAFHDQRRTGDILTRVTGDVTAVEDFVIGSLSDIVGSLLVLVGTLIFLMYNSWQVALVAVMIVPVLAFVTNYYSQRIKQAVKRQRAREGDLASSAQEMLTSIRVIQTYSRASYEQQRFSEHSQKSMDAALEASVLQARFSWVVKVLEALAIASVVWVGLWLHRRSSITVGTLLLFVVLVQNMFKPTRKIIKEWNTIGKIYASVERIGELLDRKAAVQDAHDAVVAPPFKGHVEFRNVSFAYKADPEDMVKLSASHGSARQALHDVNFAVAPGEVLALVGHTGAGKSTIAQLLPRLYDPDDGCVLIDGQDIRTLTLDSLRAQISMVLQETILFNGSVADNIAYGRTDATHEEVVTASILANAHEFIAKLPDGYETLLGERGANLSGGQRQRIAIARAFIRNTPILILDEPSTGLDAESTDLVLGALHTLMQGKTTIIISHDLNLIRHADRIVVLKEGSIEQIGTHQSLLDTGGSYAQFYARQFGVADAAPSATQGVEPAQYDPLKSPVLQRELPWLSTALDGEAMRSHLQESLLGSESAAYTIERCVPGKATYLGLAGCILRYELEITERAGGRKLTRLILARLFPDHQACASYMRERIAHLAERIQGRDDITPFVTPAAVLEPLAMAVHVFPIDAELPLLIDATDRRHMTTVLNSVLAQSPWNVAVDQCKVELGHYGRQHRCVLRYLVEDTMAGSMETRSRVIYGKLAADDRGLLATRAIAALRTAAQERGYQLNIPQSLGYLPDLQLMLLEAIPGVPYISHLIKQRLEGGATLQNAPLMLEEAIAACSGIAALLHTSGIALGQERTIEDELADCARQIGPIRRISPVLGIQLQSWLECIRTQASTSISLPLGFCHGDFTYTQVIFEGASSGLVDFDTVCQAEPALDLGSFLAYLRLTIAKARTDVDSQAALAEDCSTIFLDTYCSVADAASTDVENISRRVRLYEAISLLRIAVHSWQKLKAKRLALALAVLEERIASLPAVAAETAVATDLVQPTDAQHSPSGIVPTTTAVESQRRAMSERLRLSRRTALMYAAGALIILGGIAWEWTPVSRKPEPGDISAAMAPTVAMSTMTVVVEPRAQATTTAPAAILPAQTAAPTAVPSPRPPTSVPVTSRATLPTTMPDEQLALPDVRRIAQFESEAKSGEFDASLDLGAGSRSTVSVRFDLNDVLRLHVVTIYTGTTSTQTTEQITVGDRQWRRQKGGSWTEMPTGEDIWHTIRPLFPQAASASNVTTIIGSSYNTLRWYDVRRAGDITLVVDQATGAPRELLISPRSTGTTLLVTYRKWNTPLEIVPPVESGTERCRGTDELCRRVDRGVRTIEEQ